MNRHFITGATGFLGRNYLVDMLRNTDDEFYLLVRPNSKNLGSFEKETSFADPDRIHYVSGNLTDYNFGMSRKDFDEVKNCNKLWHFAASTSFDERYADEIRETNISGVKNIISLSNEIKNLDNLYSVSTAYTAGLNKGPIMEDIMPENIGFRNTYESSKYECEQLLRETDLPWSVFRPSIIIGDSKEPHDNHEEERMIYGYMLGVYYGIIKDVSQKKLVENWVYNDKLDVGFRLVGDTSVTKNFVCIDDVVGMIRDITKVDNIHKTYHLTSNNPIIGEDIRKAIEKSFRVTGVSYHEKEDIKNPTNGEKRSMNFTSPFEAYTLNSDPIFDTTNVDKSLKSYKKLNLDSDLFIDMMKSFVRDKLMLKLINGD